MRVLSILALVPLFGAGPAVACGFDDYPGFSHYGGFGGGYSAAEADAAREQAMIDARARFVQQFGLGESPDAAATPDPNATTADAGAAAPPPEELR